MFFVLCRRYTESAARQIMLRILNAVQYLHARDIVSSLFAFAVILHLSWGALEPRHADTCMSITYCSSIDPN